MGSIGCGKCGHRSSILFAFAIDAWWDEIVEARRAHAILVALLGDFESSKSNFIEWREFHVAVQASNTKLLQASISTANLLSDDEIDRLLLDLSWWDVRSHFTIGALNSLVFGGELAIIEDDTLRQMLADWPSHIGHLEAQQGQDYDFFLNVWMPFLRANGYLPQITMIDAPKPGRPSEQSAVIDLQLESTRSHSNMVAKEEFHNLLVQKWWIQADILGEFDATVARIDQTIQQIKSVL